MAGLTHSALRTLLLDFGGVGLLSTEMLAARRVPAENARVSPFLFRTERERPLSYQLLLSSEEETPPAVEALHRLGADAVDINLGCPAPRVRKGGGGSSLMDRTDQVRRIVASARGATSLPLSAKIRLGERFDAPALRDFCRMLEGEGIDMLTVHARLRKESFSRPPHWSWVARVREWVSIPVIANGGVLSVADAEKCLAITGADGLMIGRGAAFSPWLFADIAVRVYGREMRGMEKNLPEVYGRFVRALVERFRPERRLGRLKEFTHYFAANYAFGHNLAVAVQTSGSLEQAWQRAMEFLGRHDPEGMHGAAATLAAVEELLREKQAGTGAEQN
jgi:tRNA-dihydrouridine synthase